jgi:hypothetical protein
MTELHATVTGHVSAPPDELFALIIDVERLPDWNRCVPRLIEAPGELAAGTEWVIWQKAFGSGWASRSTVTTIDAKARVFIHRTQTTDGNASYAIWTWTIADVAGDAELTVHFELHPKTFWRRKVFARIRRRQLQREIRTSIAEADRLLVAERAAA